MNNKVFTPLDDNYAIFNSENNNDYRLLVDVYNRCFEKIKTSDDIVQQSKLLKKRKGLFANSNEMKKFCLDYKTLDMVYYNVTYRCNQRCKYCYSQSNPEEYVTLEDNEQIIDSLKKLNTKSLVLIGGEPFCHPNIDNIIKSIIQNNYFEEISIITNGTMIDDSRIRLLTSNNIGVQVSLDGYSEDTNSITRTVGSFNKIYQVIMKLKKANADVSVMQTITNENISHAFDFYKHFKKLNIPAGFFMVKNNNSSKVNKAPANEIMDLIDKIYIEEDWDILKVFDIIKIADNLHFDKCGFPSMHCGAGINTISVDPKGDVYPCVKMSYGKHKIGNILNKEALTNFIHFKKREMALPLVNNIKKCSNCDIKYFCGGGCRAEHASCKDCFDDSGCEYYRRILVYFLSKVLEERC